ncbi:MAG: hypothetical protein ACREX4_24465, partial [Gammaproteobacteria bacterium]
TFSGSFPNLEARKGRRSHAAMPKIPPSVRLREQIATFLRDAGRCWNLARGRRIRPTRSPRNKELLPPPGEGKKHNNEPANAVAAPPRGVPERSIAML